MRYAIIILFLFLLPLSIFANMANPVITGSKQSEAYSSNDIDIIDEQLRVKILDVSKALFDITYTVESSQDGYQIPLVFDMMNDTDSFYVWVNGVKTETKITSDYLDQTDLHIWKDSLRNNFDATRNYDITEFRYFEVDLPKGVNTIRVQYIAKATIDKWGWVNKYIFEYNLEPAKQWRSFKNLNVSIDATAVPHKYEVIFGDTAIVDSVKSWQFSSLPNSGITITYEPEISDTAQFLISLDPFGIMCIASLLMIVIHLYFIIRYRKYHPQKKFSIVVFLPVLFMPFIAGLIYMWAHGLIYDVIGEYATRRGSYSFLIIPFLYIFIMPIYLLGVWITDMLLKKKLRNKANR